MTAETATLTSPSSHAELPRTAAAASHPPAVSAAAGPAPARRRFTTTGSAGLEDHLARTCDRIAAGLRGLLPRSKLEAVLLGGGYGRGEGGVLRSPTGDRPYNDLEFYVCLRGNRHLNERLHGHALHVLGEILTPQAGVEVEFKITSLREMAESPVSMFSYDLISGHRWLVGSEELLAGCVHHREADGIPLSEATRLLMNRGSGLLLARERMMRPVFTAGDADFVHRNIAKAELALGDAVLVCHRQYHWSVQERHRRLQHIALTEDSAWMRELCRHHATGLQFKLHPERSTAPRDALHLSHGIVRNLALQTWLWVEQHRLRVPFRGADDYAESHVNKWPDLAGLRNALVNGKALGPRALLDRRLFRHPRERVVHAMALLLWEPAAVTSPVLRARVQRELRTNATDFTGLVHAYRELWQQVN